MKQSDSNANLNLLKQAYSETIILRRHKLGYTQKEAAEKCGITEKQYSNIERQQCFPGLSTLVNMVIALGIDINKIVNLAVEKGYVVTDKYK